MTLYIQNKILNTKNYYEYLKENSYWIKKLSRSDKYFNEFGDFVKDKYSLKVSDKINNAIDNIEIVNKVLNVIK